MKLMAYSTVAGSAVSGLSEQERLRIPAFSGSVDIWYHTPYIQSATGCAGSSREVDRRGRRHHEFAVWTVPVTARHPVGVKYRLAFIRRDAAAPALLYDNHP